MQLFKRSNITGVTFAEGRPEAKTVQVRKITIAQWRELFGAVQALPQLLISVMSAPASERLAFFVIAIEQSLDDVTRVVSIITGLDEEWIDKNAALDELVAFFVECAKVNNFADVLKNARGVLSLVNPAEVKVEQGAN